MSIDVEHCYKKYGPMVLRRTRYLLKDEELAVDIMHDVFVQLLKKEKEIVDNGLSSLLFRIATNLSLNKLRSIKRHPEDKNEELLLKIACAENVESKFMAKMHLTKIFKKEKDSTKEMAVMHLLDKMTLKEVAKELNMSVSGVRKRLRTLKAQINELEKI